MKKISENTWLKLALTGILLIVVYKSVDNLTNIFGFVKNFFKVSTPCIIGAIIALFVYVPVHKFENMFCKINMPFIKKHAKAFGLLVVYLLLAGILVTAVKYIVPVLYKNIEDLITRLPAYAVQLNNLLEQMEFLPKLDWGFLSEFLLEYFDLSRLNQYLNVITGIANSFISFLVSIIISIYMILEKDQITDRLKKIRKRLKIKKNTDIFMRYIRDIIGLFRSYFTGLLLDSILIGSVSTIVFSAFGVPYAVFLGLVVVVGNMIPFFGPIVAAIITYLISMIGLGPLNALWVLLFQFILGQIDGNVIQPKIVGSQVGVSPLVVLVAVTVFGGLFGPLGMILGVPISASVKLVLDDYLADGKIDGNTSEEEEVSA